MAQAAREGHSSSQLSERGTTRYSLPLGGLAPSRSTPPCAHIAIQGCSRGGSGEHSQTRIHDLGGHHVFSNVAAIHDTSTILHMDICANATTMWTSYHRYFMKISCTFEKRRYNSCSLHLPSTYSSDALFMVTLEDLRRHILEQTWDHNAYTVYIEGDFKSSGLATTPRSCQEPRPRRRHRGLSAACEVSHERLGP